MRTALRIWLLPVLASIVPQVAAQNATYSATTIVNSTGGNSSTSSSAGSASSASASSSSASSNITYTFSLTSSPGGSGGGTTAAPTQMPSSGSRPGGGFPMTSFSGGLPSQATAMPPQGLPTSTDAAAYLSHVFPAAAPQPTWATGRYYTELATALYAVDRSFEGRADFPTIVAAIYSAGEAAGPQISASLAASAWGWAQVTTNGWYQSDVPRPVRDDVADYVDAWHAAENRVLRAATSGDGGEDGGEGGEDAAPGKGSGAAMLGGCGAVVIVGVVAGVVGFLGLV